MMLPPLRDDVITTQATLTISLLSNAHINESRASTQHELADFLTLLTNTLDRCTESNVKHTSDFIVGLILPSSARVLALCQYLCTLARCLTPDQSLDEQNALVPQSSPSIHKRHHLFLLMSNVLAIAVLRIRNDDRHNSTYSINDTSIDYLKHALRRLARLAACGDNTPAQSAARVYEAIVYRLDSFEKKKILSHFDVAELKVKLDAARRQTFSDMLSYLAKDEAQMAIDSQLLRQAESSQWKIPERHSLPGDPDPPWHELPAANGLHLRKTARQRGGFKSSALPSGGFVLVNRGRKASAAVQKDVQDMLEEAKRCFDTYTDFTEVEDIDALGNLVWKKETGRRRRTHWGHSYENIQAKQDRLAH